MGRNTVRNFVQIEENRYLGDRMNDKITIHGAREHNLKNIDLEIPRDKLIVFTGLSGSGKFFPCF